MATYDLTSKDTAFVSSDSIASLPIKQNAANMYMIETTLDIAKMAANGYVMAAGDIFQALEIPAGCFVLFAGVEVTTAFDGTTPTVNLDFAEGDDIVDGGDLSSAGWLASGTNGQAMASPGAASTFVQHVTATDTIDFILAAGAADVTVGVARIVACVVSTQELGGGYPTEVGRDQLA